MPELLFSSPFFRCIQTASYTAKRLGLPLKLEHGVQEWYVEQPSPVSPIQPAVELTVACHTVQVFPSLAGYRIAPKAWSRGAAEAVLPRYLGRAVWLYSLRFAIRRECQ